MEQQQGYMLQLVVPTSYNTQIQRIVTIGYKDMKDSETGKPKGKHPNLYVAIPILDLSDVVADAPAGIVAVISDALQEHQNQIIRNYADALRASGSAPEGHYITDYQLALPQIVTYCIAEAASKRLKTDSIAAWFDANLMEKIAAAIVAKNPAAEDAVIAKQVEGWKVGLSKLAAVSPKINKSDAQKMLNVLTKYAPADSTRDALNKRLDLILNPPSAAFELGDLE